MEHLVAAGMFFTDMIDYDATGTKPGTWHWPERVD
jgi:hypothetical protein